LNRSLLSALLAVAIACVACTSDQGGSSPTEPSSPTSTVPATTTTIIGSHVAVEEFEDCLFESGIEASEIVLDAQGRPRLDLLVPEIDFTDEDIVLALSGCSEFLATGALDLSSSPALKDSVIGLLEEFAECVRSRGVPEFPDVIEGFSGVGGPFPLAEIPYADPDLGEAIEACKVRVAADGD